MDEIPEPEEIKPEITVMHEAVANPDISRFTTFSEYADVMDSEVNALKDVVPFDV